MGKTMSEKDILAQIEADLQSGNDVVEWSGVRVMNEAERKTEYRFLYKHLFLKKFLLPSIVVTTVLYALLAFRFDLAFVMWSGFAVLCAVTLISMGVYGWVRKYLSSKSHALIHVNIDFKKESIDEQRLSGRERHPFHQQGQTLKLLPELLEDKSPETVALRQRVQTLLHEKTGLHFE